MRILKIFDVINDVQEHVIEILIRLLFFLCVCVCILWSSAFEFKFLFCSLSYWIMYNFLSFLFYLLKQSKTHTLAHTTHF